MTSADARPLKEWFPQWIDSLTDRPHLSDEDRTASRHSATLRKLRDSGNVNRRLKKIYDALLRNSTAEAEKKTKHFLVSACVQWFGGEPYGSPNPTHSSVRQRKLSRLAKAVRRLAEGIHPETMSLLIPPGRGRREFLRDRLFDPHDIFRFGDEIDVYRDPNFRGDYAGDKFEYPLQFGLYNQLSAFAGAINTHVKWLSSQPTHRNTRLNRYVDTLAHYCSTDFGRVHRAFIVDVARVISRKKITADMIRKRRKIARPS